MSRFKIIDEYRQKKIIGEIVDLSPVNENVLYDIIRMRNNPEMMQAFNQSVRLTIDDQKIWYKKYLQRDNDLYWTINDKTGRVIGTNRIYDISHEKCEHGSLMIDDEYAMVAPYAVEAIMLSIDFAFDVLDINTIICKDRHDNKNMNSITKRFGFEFLCEMDIRGVSYNYYELYPENYRKKDVEDLIQLWVSRE